MKKTEGILVLLLIISVILKYCRIPFGGVFFTFVGLIMCIYYSLGSFLLFNDIRLKRVFDKGSYSSIGMKEILVSLWAGISLAFITISLLFSLNRWSIEGARIFLLNGLLLSVLCLGLSAIFLITKPRPTYRKILWRLLPATILSVAVVW